MSFTSFADSVAMIAPYAIPLMFSFSPDDTRLIQDRPLLVDEREQLDGGSSRSFQPLQSSQAITKSAVTEHSHERSYVSSQAAGWMDPILDQLKRISEYDDGWKGEDSVAPEGKAIEEAAWLLRQISIEVPDSSAPLVGADEEGFIALLWNEPEIMASVSIYGDGTYSYYAESGLGSAKSDAEAIGDPIPIILATAIGGHVQISIAAE